MLADCAVDLESVRWTTYAAASRHDGRATSRIRDSVIKVLGSEALCRVADRVLQFFGGWGYSTDLPVEQFYREARVWRIVEGPGEIHRALVGRCSASTAFALSAHSRP